MNEATAQAALQGCTAPAGQGEEQQTQRHSHTTVPSKMHV